MHPINDIRGSKSSRLAGKRIVLAVTGSIAAVEDVKLARELVRHGADVIPVMTAAAARIVHPDSLEFATGHRPILELTGAVEHVAICGQVPDHADLLLIAPSTANTVSKIACAIDDTPVTTFATTAIGTGIPVIIVPAMHESMYRHKGVQENVEKLKRMGITFVGPAVSEGKAKMASIEEVVAAVIRRIGGGGLAGVRVLVTGGATEEPIDDMRVVTNRGTGATGAAIAEAAHLRGADVTLWLGRGAARAPSYIKTERFATVADLMKLASAKTRFDVVIHSAAVGDYAPERTMGKIPSGKAGLDVRMKPLPKVVSRLRKAHPKAVFVAFKAESGKPWTAIEEAARELARREGLDIVWGNDLAKVRPDANEMVLVFGKGPSSRHAGSKRELADILLDAVAGALVGRDGRKTAKGRSR